VKVLDEVLDDDSVGNVERRSNGAFCLDMAAADSTEVWMGLLSPGNRYAVALLNRGTVNATITVDWTSVFDPAASVEVFDIWEDASKGIFVGNYSANVVPYGVAFLIITS